MRATAEGSCWSGGGVLRWVVGQVHFAVGALTSEGRPLEQSGDEEPHDEPQDETWEDPEAHPPVRRDLAGHSGVGDGDPEDDDHQQEHRQDPREDRPATVAGSAVVEEEDSDASQDDQRQQEPEAPAAGGGLEPAGEGGGWGFRCGWRGWRGRTGVSPLALGICPAGAAGVAACVAQVRVVAPVLLSFLAPAPFDLDADTSLEPVSTRALGDAAAVLHALTFGVAGLPGGAGGGAGEELLGSLAFCATARQAAPVLHLRGSRGFVLVVGVAQIGALRHAGTDGRHCACAFEAVGPGAAQANQVDKNDDGESRRQLALAGPQVGALHELLLFFPSRGLIECTSVIPTGVSARRCKTCSNFISQYS